MMQKVFVASMLVGAFSMLAADKCPGEVGSNEERPSAGNSSEQKTISPSDGFVMPDEILHKYMRAGLDGDGSAAFRVYLHYNFLDDAANASYWAKISAENGHWEGMLILAHNLMNSRKNDSCRRGQFWIKRADRVFQSGKNARAQSSIDHATKTLTVKCGSIGLEKIDPSLREQYGR